MNVRHMLNMKLDDKDRFKKQHAFSLMSAAMQNLMEICHLESEKGVYFGNKDITSKVLKILYSDLPSEIKNKVYLHWMRGELKELNENKNPKNEFQYYWEMKVHGDVMSYAFVEDRIR